MDEKEVCEANQEEDEQMLMLWKLLILILYTTISIVPDSRDDRLHEIAVGTKKTEKSSIVVKRHSHPWLLLLFVAVVVHGRVVVVQAGSTTRI